MKKERIGSAATPLEAVILEGLDSLSREDGELCGLLVAEQRRQEECLSLVASSSIAHPSVVACEASVAVNVTAEGYPARRFHGGCHRIDDIERLAIERCRRAFGARFANVQPHSASIANHCVILGLLGRGDVVLGMSLASGGHLTHGAPASVSGSYFKAIGYGVDENGLLDYEEVLRLAERHRPKLIICGATAYPRIIDFRRFRDIADEVGAYLLADITHVAGLVVAGLHPNPIHAAHVTTTCTHKQLFGPRGGLILSGRDAASSGPKGKGTWASFLDSTVFPFIQGAPIPNLIAAKARALHRACDDRFVVTARRIVDTARWLAEGLIENGYDVVTRGTDNHIVLLDLRKQGLTGVVAETALSECGIMVNRNTVPGDERPPRITSGIRLGTNAVAQRRLGREEIAVMVEWISRALSAVEMSSDVEGGVDPSVSGGIRAEVRRLCASFPVYGLEV